MIVSFKRNSRPVSRVFNVFNLLFSTAVFDDDSCELSMTWLLVRYPVGGCLIWCDSCVCGGCCGCGGSGACGTERGVVDWWFSLFSSFSAVFFRACFVVSPVGRVYGVERGTFRFVFVFSWFENVGSDDSFVSFDDFFVSLLFFMVESGELSCLAKIRNQ